MKPIVVDTSVVVKWFSPEEDEEKAKQLLVYHTQEIVDFIFPEAILLELMNVLHFSKKFSKSDARETFHRLLAMNPNIISFSETLMNETLSVMYAHKITSYDACFVAAANLNACPLITADYKHHAKSLSLAILWLSEWNGTV